MPRGTPSEPGEPGEDPRDPPDHPAWRAAGPAAAAGVLAAYGLARAPWITERPALAAALVVAAGVGVVLAAAGFLRRFAREKPTLWLPLAALFFAYAAWAAVTHERVGVGDLRALVTAEPTPVVVTGTLTGGVKIRSPDTGAFAAFNYRRDRTTCRLDAESVWDPELRREVPLHGTAFFKVNEPVPWLAEGQRVRVSGKLQAFSPPENPGSRDFAGAMAHAGVAGRLTVNKAAGVEVLEPPAGVARNFALLRQRLRERAWGGLQAGFDAGDPAAALLGSLLLGRSDPKLDGLREDFRRVGLSHLLSISGAHLGVLVLLLLGVTRALPLRPDRATLLALLGVGAYLLLVPARVPVLRAALMALAILGPGLLGRRIPVGRSLTLAALFVLAWRPGDLFAPGFQLSFLAVWAIARFARPLSLAMHPEALKTGGPPGWSTWWKRVFFDYLGMSIAAAAVAAPVVLYHFGLFSPLAVLGSLLSWPVFTLVLMLGHVKLALGLLHPAAGAWLGVPLGWLLDLSAWAVAGAASLPATAWAPPRPVGLAWAAATTAWVVALLSLPGRLPRRRRALPLLACVLPLGAWLAVSEGALDRFRAPPLLSQVTVAVGDGSAHLLRSGGGALLFDCGSSTISRIGEKEVVPTLRALGVRRLDVLVVSHADLDHFSGVLEVAAALPVARVLVSPEVPAEAADLPEGAAAVLLAGLAELGVPVEVIARGSRFPLGDAGAVASVLWPPAGLTLADASNSNDHSVVLRTELPASGGRPARSVLLSGDIQQFATRALLEDPAQLRSTVADIPHHGSLVKASSDWLAAADPAVLFQSTGRRRLQNDKWAALLDGRSHVRLVTARGGMLTVEVLPDGSLRYATFRGGGGRVVPGR